MALEIGLTKPTVNRWKNGGGVTDATAVKIARYFNISLAELKETKKEPVSQEANGLHSVGYNDLTPENQRLIDSMIEKLLKSQFGE